MRKSRGVYHLHGKSGWNGTLVMVQDFSRCGVSPGRSPLRLENPVVHVSAVMAATLNVLSVHVVIGFIFLARYYAQFLSALNTGHLYHPSQVLIPLKKHFKVTCFQLTGRSLRYPICRWHKHDCVCFFLSANALVPIDLTNCRRC